MNVTALSRGHGILLIGVRSGPLRAALSDTNSGVDFVSNFSLMLAN
jgi:hypothetical protein